jgi:hypothetical protein
MTRGRHHRPMAHDHRWDLVDAVSRSPLLGPPRIRPGIDLASVERRLLVTDELPAAERERLLDSVRELADVFSRLGAH